MSWMSRLRSRAPGRDEWYCRISSPSIPRRNREGQVAVYKRRRRRVPALEGFYFHDKTESGDDGFEYCSGFSVAGFVRHIRNNLCVRREDIFVKQTRLPIGPQIESESALPQADFRSWKPRLISSAAPCRAESTISTYAFWIEFSDIRGADEWGGD